VTLLVTALALVAALGAALCAFADGALLSLDEDDPPPSETARAMLARRERTHRALAFGRIIFQLLAGAAAAVALRSSGVPAAEVAPLVIVAGIIIVVVAESASRSAGDAVGFAAVDRLSAIMRAVEWLLTPVVAFGGWFDRVLAELMPPAAPDEDDREATLEQFREVVAAETDATRDEEVLLRGVFSLGETTVQEIMVPRVDIVGLEKDTPWSEVVDRVRSARHSRLVVFDGTLDEVVGILFAKDLLPAFVADDEPVAGWLSLVRPALFIPGTKQVDAQLVEFRSSHRHIAIVVDEYGGTSGLVTLEDVLELIIGDIRDEYDIEEPDVIREDDDKFWVAAGVSLDHLSELTGHDFTRDDVKTVGGLVYEIAGRVPRNGEILEVGGFRMIVERVVRRRVERVYLERLHARAGGAA
jgi:CBS domain containing-hemolysin-like protein